MIILHVYHQKIMHIIRDNPTQFMITTIGNAFQILNPRTLKRTPNFPPNPRSSASHSTRLQISTNRLPLHHTVNIADHATFSHTATEPFSTTLETCFSCEADVCEPDAGVWRKRLIHWPAREMSGRRDECLVFGWFGERETRDHFLHSFLYFTFIREKNWIF
jgi:hypothetical protein